MNNYEQKQQARKERYAELAERTREKAEKMSEAGWTALRAIPFGQPILVGHHSEKSDRSYRSRAVNKIDRSAEEYKKADYYENKVKAIESNRVISSDDPEAVEKLQEKIDKQEALQKMMVGVNKLIRSKRLLRSEKIGKIVNEFEIREITATKLVDEPDCFGNYGFPRYQLSNNSANIKRMKERAEQLKRKTEMTAGEDIVGPGYIVKEDLEDNRIKILFEAIPPVETRTALKSHGFRWSPYNKAWQRMLNGNGRYALKQLLTKI